MGYTHYWNRPENLEEGWSEFLKGAKNIIKKSGVKLDGLEANKDIIRFDGGCETFYLPKVGEGGFNFCKTRQLPYDIVVVAILFLAQGIFKNFKFSSDGDTEDLKSGHALFTSVIGGKK